MDSSRKNYFKRKRDTQYHPYKDIKKGRVIPEQIMKSALLRSLEQKAFYADGHIHANTTGECVSLFHPAAGTGTLQRVGSKVTYKGLNIAITAKAGAAINTINWVLLYDKETRGAIPTMSNIWSAQTGMGPRAHQYKGRFVVLAKGNSILDSNAANSGMDKQRWDIYVPLKGKLCRFNTLTNGDVGDIDAGSLIFAASGDVASGATDTTLQYNSTVTFIDA